MHNLIAELLSKRGMTKDIFQSSHLKCDQIVYSNRFIPRMKKIAFAACFDDGDVAKGTAATKLSVLSMQTEMSAITLHIRGITSISLNVRIALDDFQCP